MVSPADKLGALIEPIGEDWVIQAAAGGGRLAYVADAPTEPTPAGYLLYQSVLATRGSGGGWSSRDLSIGHLTPTDLSLGKGWEYRFFSEDLSRAIVQPFGEFVPCESASGEAQPCLSPEASEQTAFLDSLYSGGAGSREPCATSCFTPLVTGAEGYEDVPAGTKFGERNTLGDLCPPEVLCGPEFEDATPDANHVLLRSWAALTTSPASKHSIPPRSLYEWSEDAPAGEQLRLVSVLPGNEHGEALPAPDPTLGLSLGNMRHVISDDGERVVWGSEGKHLYLRENATRPQSALGEHGECLVASDACTIQLDAGLPLNAYFQTANSDLTRIFFTEGNGSLEGSELFEYDVETRQLTALTGGLNVIGAIIGASEDGSWVYFVAGNGACPYGTSASERCDLYVMHYDGAAWGSPQLITVLSGADSVDWGGEHRDLTQLNARVSPNGEWLAFMSQDSLTGYDNRDAVSGEPDQEVYEYNAAAGTLACASCDPTGARPAGLSAEPETIGIVGGKEALNGWIAGIVPPWTPNDEGASIYQSRYLSDSGRLFFDSSDQLVPKDINKTEDVYEYEPEGEHACTSTSESGSVAFKPPRSTVVEGRTVQEGAGCVGLISSGESAQQSVFLDASETGSEVFFLTTAKLVPEDTDTSYDVYDARECTPQSPCEAPTAEQPPPCDNEASCKPAPSPQPEIFGPSGSATFSGPGNLITPLATDTTKPAAKPLTKAQKLTAALKTCKKDKKKAKRQACEKQARKKYGARKASRSIKASRASNDRRAK